MSDPDTETCAIQTIQHRLNELGFNAGAADNVEGPATRSAVVRFKRQHSLAARPYLGEQTLGLLFSGEAEPYAPPAVPDTSDAPWLDYGLPFEGLVEIPGPEHNPQIVRWGREAGITWWNNDDDAWCAVYVNGCLVNTGYRSTRSALAKSFQGADGAFAPGGYGRRLDLSQPLPRGAILVFNRGSNLTFGHVAVLIEDLGSRVLTINGNVGNRVCKSIYARNTIVSAWYPDERCVA